MVSVLMPVYNEAQYVADAVESILGQTYRNFELIVIDDASEDETVSIIKRYQDRRVTLIRMVENKGKSVCLNWGLAMARGRYILEMDGDDWLEPEALEVLVGEGERLPGKIAYIYSDRNVYYEGHKGSLKLDHISKGIPFKDRYQFLATLRAYGPRFIRAKALRAVGGWPVDYPTGGRLFEDFALVLKLLDRYEFYYVPKRLYNIRRHQENISRVHKKLWWPVCKALVEDALVRWGGEYRAVLANKRSRFRLLKTVGEAGD